MLNNSFEHHRKRMKQLKKVINILILKTKTCLWKILPFFFKVVKYLTHFNFIFFMVYLKQLKKVKYNLLFESV